MKLESTNFFTVCTPKYLRLVNACYKSLRQHNSNFEYHVLLVEKEEEYGSQNPYPFKMLRLQDLSISSWKEMFQRFNAFELCNALRPVMAKHLVLTGGSQNIVYLDVDTLVTGSFDGVISLLEEKLFCLSPHILEPYPLDNDKPDDLTLTSLGVYNSGFWAFRNSKEVIPMLDFLISRNLYYCFNQPPLMFYGQNILHLFASLFSNDCGQINDPAYNIAYWNLHERDLTCENNIFLVNNKPVVFFHFSGFDEHNPSKLTKWPFRENSRSLPIMLKALNQYLDLLKS